MKTIRSKPNKSFPGDKSIAIQSLSANGQFQTLFNIYPKSDKFGKHYENDRYAGCFASVKEAKEFAAAKAGAQ